MEDLQDLEPYNSWICDIDVVYLPGLERYVSLLSYIFRLYAIMEEERLVVLVANQP